MQTHILNQGQTIVNPFNDGYKLLVLAVIWEIRNRMLPLHRRLLILIKLTSGQTWMSSCGDIILTYQVWIAINYKNQSFQISLSTSCAVIFSSLTDPSTALIISLNNLHFEIHVKFIGLTFGPVLTYKVFNENAHLSIHILSLYV
jgi:hypothetical protein